MIGFLSISKNAIVSLRSCEECVDIDGDLNEMLVYDIILLSVHDKLGMGDRPMRVEEKIRSKLIKLGYKLFPIYDYVDEEAGRVFKREFFVNWEGKG